MTRRQRRFHLLAWLLLTPLLLGASWWSIDGRPERLQNDLTSLDIEDAETEDAR